MGTSAPTREYKAFEPPTDWVREDGFDTLRIHLPGFTKEQLRVQISSSGNLKVTGERPVSGNKWSQFRIEMPISSNYDSDSISAKFDNSILNVKFPKIITSAEPPGEEKPAVQRIKPPEPTPMVEPPKTGQKQDTKPVPAKRTEDVQKPKEVKEESKKADEAKYGPETALQKKKSEDLASRRATEEDHKWGETANIGKRMEKAGTSDAGDIGSYEENVGSYVPNLKKLRNLMNTMVATLLIVLLGLYVKHVLRSLGTPKSDPEL